MSRPRKSRYARLEGTAWRHRVTSALSVEGMSLWARCLSYCPDAMSDGVVPAHMLGAIKGGRVSEKQLRAGLAELLSAGLLTKRDDGDYEMRGYLKHNISRAADEAALERDKARHGNGGSFRPETQPETVSVSEPIPCTPLTHDSGLMTHDSDHDPRGSSDQVTRAPALTVALSGHTSVQGVIPRPTPRTWTIPELEAATEADYAERWAAAYREPWRLDEMTDRVHMRRVVRWCLDQPDPAEAAREVVAGAFATKRWEGRRVPWVWIAESPGTAALVGRTVLAKQRAEPSLGGGETVADLAADLRRAAGRAP